MRALGCTLLGGAILALSSCGAEDQGKPAPTDRFYFPTGIALAKAAGSDSGFLYVASSNFDKRYDHGTVMALDLSSAGLPEFGREGGKTEPLAVPPEGRVLIQSIAGELGSFALADGGTRLFVPSRAEGHRLQTVEALGGTLSCFFPPSGNERDCIASSPSLVENEGTSTGVPRAPDPFGVGVSADGEVFVTQLDAVDSPSGSHKNWRAYLVKVSGHDPVVTDESFIQLGGLANAAAVGSRYAFLAGRADPRNRIGPTDFHLVTLVDRVSHALVQPLLEKSFQVLDSRGLALSTDERRLYLSARFPDTLVVVDVAGATTDSPVLKVVRSVPLPQGPNQVKILPRSGRGDLVAVTCSTAGIVVLYDADLGDLVAQVPSVGNQPFGIAVERQVPGFRLFVTNFADGRVAVIDVPDDAPQLARVVHYLGAPQTCDTTPNDSSCEGAVAR